MLARLLLIIQCIVLLSIGVLGIDKTYRLRGTIIPNEILKDVSQIATRATAVVNGGERRGFIQSDGSFVVDNLELGDSLLEISAVDYAFPKIHVRISLKEDDKGTTGGGRASVAARFVQTGSEWSEDTPLLGYPLQIEASAKYDFFTPRQGFDIVAMFSNPYMLMVGASLVAVFLLPKLQANIDPEAMKELQNKS
ncbi:hypothetical protein COEREDRAFT_79225 [Coemansia reversa NRRL 1564]|uniref:ER membrane protein complex subunit 7 beta-sandwich domain-containing protein n=1 Tax=Coemansia reversa (strain ATCC 12441 / NRRL 1564) TaxID=763665 RepID=A0A2G5BJR6_COERN|nr:hypothetical protein COEREDRAFT_79225 [Coemansia reversa NRRL 1564]|eukprot:PIA19274.1 hypothetical protein COEREDRAFT_79225 [Coemansia reversa NRRL 1564]